MQATGYAGGLDFAFADKTENTVAFEFHAHQDDVLDNEYAPFEMVWFDKASA